MKLHTLILALVTGAALVLTPVGASAASACRTTAAAGSCGPYVYPQITGTTVLGTRVGNNVWYPIVPWKQRLVVVSPGNWEAVADLAKGRTAVESYPSVGANYGEVSGAGTPLSDYTSIYSSVNEDMHANGSTSAWAAYDIWLGVGSSTKWSEEILIQHDYYKTDDCPVSKHVVFGGYNGAPRLTWNLCIEHKGSFIIWKLPSNAVNVRINILSMLDYLTRNGYLAKNSGLLQVGYGWEIASTGGINEAFNVSRFSITAVKR